MEISSDVFHIINHTDCRHILVLLVCGSFVAKPEKSLDRYLCLCLNSSSLLHFSASV